MLIAKSSGVRKEQKETITFLICGSFLNNERGYRWWSLERNQLYDYERFTSHPRWRHKYCKEQKATPASISCPKRSDRKWIKTFYFDSRQWSFTMNNRLLCLFEWLHTNLYFKRCFVKSFYNMKIQIEFKSGLRTRSSIIWYRLCFYKRDTFFEKTLNKEYF